MTTGPILWGGANTAFNLQGTMKSNAYIVAGGGTVQFNNSANTFSTSLEAGSNTANATFQLPIADGSSGQFLSTNGSGVLSFASAGGGGGSPAFNVAANDSNVVFTSADNPYQMCTPTNNRTYTLPAVGLSVGMVWTFFNQAIAALAGNDCLITLQAPDLTVIDYVLSTGYTQIVALSATPTTAADWTTVSAASNWIYDNNPNTFSSGTSGSSQTRYYRRTGVGMDIRSSGNLGSTTGSTLEWVVPAGMVIHPNAEIDVQVGWCNNAGGVTTQIGVQMPTGGANYLVLAAQGSYLTYLPGNTFASPTNIMLTAFGVPINNWGPEY